MVMLAILHYSFIHENASMTLTVILVSIQNINTHVKTLNVGQSRASSSLTLFVPYRSDIDLCIWSKMRATVISWFFNLSGFI